MENLNRTIHVQVYSGAIYKNSKNYIMVAARFFKSEHNKLILLIWGTFHLITSMNNGSMMKIERFWSKITAPEKTWWHELSCKGPGGKGINIQLTFRLWIRTCLLKIFSCLIHDEIKRQADLNWFWRTFSSKFIKPWNCRQKASLITAWRNFLLSSDEKIYVSSFDEIDFHKYLRFES